MATPEPYPYRKLNYPINNLEQSFTQEQKLQTRSNIGIPSSVDNEDKVLMVDNAAGELVWAEAPNGLPDIASGDEGKFLSVENGEPAWTDVDIPEQVNADWDATSGVQEILNKPNLSTVATTGQYADLLGKPDIPASTSELVNDSGFITASEAPVQDVKVDGSSVVDGNGVANISIPQFQQLNSDWDATSGVQEILNRPEVKPLVAGSNITITETPSSVEIAGIPTVQLNADWDATSGVQEILNKPSIPSGTQLVPAATASDADKVLTVNSQGIPEWLAKDGTDLFYVTYNVTTYDEIKAARDAGKWPVLIDSAGRVAPMVDFDYIGTSSSIQNVKFQVSEYDYHSDTDGADYYNTVYNLELEIDPDMHRTETWSVMHNYSSADWDAVSGPRVIRNKPDLSIYAEKSDLATVATTGSYDDLADKPTIPSAQVNADWDATSGVAAILNKPNLATVATTGDYSDLQNLPSIPAAQINSDWSATSGVQEILNKPTVKQVVAGSNITITETASTFEISSTGGSQVNSDWDATSGVAEILNKPTIPTKTSDLTNDSGFVTLSDLPPEEVEVLTYGTSTIEEYRAALQAGKKIIVCKVHDPDDGWRYVMQSVSSPFPEWSYDIGVVHCQLRLDHNGVTGWTTLTTNSTTSADAGKVFTVDQYGRQVWAAAQGTTYSAGTGIDITSNEISVDYDTNTLDVTGQAVTEKVTQQSASGLFLLPSSVAALLSQQADTQVTVHIPANMLRDVNFDYSDEPSITFRFTLYATDSTSETNVSLFSTALSWENYDGEYGLIDEQDIVFNLPANVANQWSQSLSSAVAFSICGQRYSRPLTDSPVELFGDLSTDPITFTFVDASATKLAVKNPLPASTSAEAGKYLKVDANGDPTWATGGGGGGGVNADWDETDPLEPSYIENKPTPKTLTAGANISISEGVGTLTISAAAGLPASTSADEGKCLVVDSNGDPEWGTGGKTYTGTDGVVVDNVNDTVGLEAPVDIVAGPGIAIDNPDGNTVRVSLASTPYNETVLWEADLTVAVQDRAAGTTFTLSETPANFEILKVYCAKKWPVTEANDCGAFCNEVSTAMLSKQNGGVMMLQGFMAANDVVYQLYTKLTGCLTTTITEASGLQTSTGQGSLSASLIYLHPYRIVGINRISGGN